MPIASPASAFNLIDFDYLQLIARITNLPQAMAAIAVSTY
jgi:hypothetical protein